MSNAEPRLALIEHIRQQIARGTYLTDARIRAAMRRLIEVETGEDKSG